jgi:hypothetical protein
MYSTDYFPLVGFLYNIAGETVFQELKVTGTLTSLQTSTEGTQLYGISG